MSPAGAALGLPLDEVDKRVYFVAPGAALPHRLYIRAAARIASAPTATGRRSPTSATPPPPRI